MFSQDTKHPSSFKRFLAKFLWFISTARNIIVVLCCSIGCYLLEEHFGSSPVILTGHVKQGLPEVEVPPFKSKIGNETLDFFDMLSALGSGCIVVPMLSILETIAIAKAFRKYLIVYRIHLCFFFFFQKSNFS